MRNPKRVLFVERNLRNEKLGVMYLAGSLKTHGHHADLVQTDKDDLHDKIREYRPDFVAFSITTGEHVHALKTALLIKRRYGIPNIFGGPHCTFFPEIAYEPDIDFAVQGQGERTIVDIVEGRVVPGFHKSEMAEKLDDIPHPDREIFYQFDTFRNNPMKNVITSRACPYKCSYCFNHSQMALTRIDGETQQWFSRRRVDDVVAEINAIRDRYPLDKVLFLDDSFIQGRGWLDDFLTGYTDHVRLPWLCSLRVNCLDEALAKRMFKSGLEMINYAIESADPDVQQRLLHRGHISNGDVIRAIAMFDHFGVRARMQNMIGLPLSNPLEDALNTLQFNMRHRVTDAWCSIFQPYPRTALGQYCVDHEFISNEQLRHCAESFFDESRLDIHHKSELYALQKLWYFVIEGDLPLDLVRVLIRGDFTLEIGDALQRLRFRCSRKKLYGIDDAAPETSVNMQSRERMAIASQTQPSVAVATDDSASAIRAALQNCPLPPEFADIMSTIRFDDQTSDALQRLARGERVCEPPLYTINDTTGELADPDVSIYQRGVPDADAHDIRKMPESHFMRQMDRVRDDLIARRADPDLQASEVIVSIGEIDSEDESTPRRTPEDADERHLNQYLA